MESDGGGGGVIREKKTAVLPVSRNVLLGGSVALRDSELP